MSQAGWIWDASRRSYYTWSANEQCYVYQDGTRLPLAQEQTYQQPSMIAPRVDNIPEATTALMQQQQSTYFNPNTSTYQTHRASISTGSGAGNYDLSQALASMTVNPGSPQTAYTHLSYQTLGTTSTAASYPAQAGPVGTRQTQSYAGHPSLQTGPQEDITDKDLFKKGARARGKIKGTRGQTEELDPNFFVRTDAKRFFHVGKVIKILWPELPGNTTENVTVISDAKFEKENFISKIRWFVVVREGRESCTCVPISTYGHQGCGKAGLAKWQHCIVYTSKGEPDLLQGETPGKGEHGMQLSIRVRTRDKGDKMYAESRINYGKMYTVEHNVKVYDFGDVHKNFISILERQWKYVLNCSLDGKSTQEATTTTTTTTAGTATTPQAQAGQTGGNLPAVEEGKVLDDSNANYSEPPSLPLHGTANLAWNDSRDGQLAFKKDDRILVKAYADENWATGRNESTRCEGLFPAGYVTLDGADFATALRDNEYDKEKPDQLIFKRGDRIQVKGYLSASWDTGRNTRTGTDGKYAQRWVKMDRGTFAIAQTDYDEDIDDPGRLLFKKKDRILVTYGNKDSWAWGRNERTRQEGRFPGVYVKFND